MRYRFDPDPIGQPRRRHNSLLCLRAVVSAGMIVGVATGCSSAASPATPTARSTPAADDTYGTLPSFLPSADVRPDSVLVGRAGRPALTSEGDTVRVHDGASTVLATVSGPQVPGEGFPHEPDSTTCTWVVTLTDVTGRIPVAASAFTTLDHLGHRFALRYVPGHGPSSAVLLPGRRTSFELRAVMPTGEGLLRWAPRDGKIVAAWDFEVETD